MNSLARLFDRVIDNLNRCRARTADGVRCILPRGHWSPTIPSRAHEAPLGKHVVRWGDGEHYDVS